MLVNFSMNHQHKYCQRSTHIKQKCDSKRISFGSIFTAKSPFPISDRVRVITRFDPGAVFNSKNLETYNSPIKELFDGGLEQMIFRQNRKLKDCYLLGGMDVLARFKTGRRAICGAVRQVQKDVYQIIFKAMPEKSVKVAADDINNGIQVIGDKGLKVFEVAYGKLRQQIGYPIGKKPLEVLDLGFTDEFLHHLTGWQKVGARVSPKSTDKARYLLYQAADNPDKYYLVASHLTEARNGSNGTRLGFWKNHVYSIVDVNKKNEKVLLADTYDNSVLGELSINDFCGDFTEIRGVKAP